MEDKMTNAQLAKIEVEIAKMMAENSKLAAETSKLTAEAAKMIRERNWYPVIVVAAAFTAGATLAKLLIG